MKTVEAQTLTSLSPVLPSGSTQPTTTKQPATTKQLFKEIKTKLTDSPTGGPDTDLIKAIDDVKKNAKDIYNFAYKKIQNYQKELDKIATELEEGVKNKGIFGPGINALVVRPIVKLIRSLVSLDPLLVVDQLNDNSIFNFYDLLDNMNVIPEGNQYLQTISNFYDWIQVIADLKPFVFGGEVDPYTYIEAATDLAYALKESTIVGQIPSLDVFNASLMSAYIMSKAGAPIARYMGNPQGGLKLFGFEPEKNKTKITEFIDKHYADLNKEINNAIISGNTKAYEILNTIGNKFPWVKTFSEKSNLNANEMYLMEHTRDIIINKLKIYNIVYRAFKTFKNGQKWGVIRAQVNWDTLSQGDKQFINTLVENFKKTNL